MKKSTVLSLIASTGVIFTAYSAGRATPKAIEKIERRKKELRTDRLTKKETLKTVWKDYIPTAGLAGATIFCILSSNALNQKQQALLLSSYNLLRDRYEDYKRKVIEEYGVDIHKKFMQELEIEKAKKVYISANSLAKKCILSVDDTDEKEVIRTFYDVFSQRYFETSLSKVVEAEYHLNREYVERGFSYVNEFYNFLGIGYDSRDDNIGWDCESGVYWIDFHHRLETLDDDMEVIFIEFPFEPEVIYP